LNIIHFGKGCKYKFKYIKAINHILAKTKQLHKTIELLELFSIS